MVTMTATATREAIEGFAPVLKGLEENMREAKRAILHGRRTAEDLVAAGALQVRRHPMRALAVAVGAGAFAGCLIGFAIGWRRHKW